MPKKTPIINDFRAGSMEGISTPMDKVSLVFNCVAVRTENNQIIQRMILWIKVFVVYAENFCVFIISTLVTPMNKISSSKISLNAISFVNYFYRILLILVLTFIRAIFSFISLAFVYWKFLATFNATNKKFRTRPVLSMFFTFIRAILGWIRMYPNFCEFFTTNRTKCSSFYKTFCKVKFTRTCARTKKCFIFSALFNIKFFPTYLANFDNSFFMKRFPFAVFMITRQATKLLFWMRNFKFFFTYLTNCYSHPIRITEILYYVNKKFYLYGIKREYSYYE